MSALPETLDAAQAEIRRLRAEIVRMKGQRDRAWRDRQEIHRKYEALLKSKRERSGDE